MLVPDEAFDKLMNLFANACTLNGISNFITRAFLQFLESQKEHLVESESINFGALSNSSNCMMEALDQDKRLKRFITKFFSEIRKNPELDIKDREAEIIERVTKVLHSIDM